MSQIMTENPRSPVELRNMFGANLRQLADRHGSISALSRKLGINRTQFNRYLAGESFPRPDVLERICQFFEVDARILLEPVGNVATPNDTLTGTELGDFVGVGVRDVPAELFPAGFYRFSRRSFVRSTLFIVGMVYVYRKDGVTYMRGYEDRNAMELQGLPTDATAREFRGLVTRQENGIAVVISRRNAMTCSFNYLSRAASFDNNFWVGYVTRTVPEHDTGVRAVRLAYEHLGNDGPKVRHAARNCGFYSEEELMPFHRRLLKPDQEFR